MSSTDVDEAAAPPAEPRARTREDPAPAPSTSDGGNWFEPWQVAVIVSKRRKGKSTIAQVFASYMTRSRVLLVDVKRRYRMPDADAVCHGVDELRAAPTSAWRLHFIPTAVATVADKQAVAREYDDLFLWACEQTDLCVLLDECVPMPAPASGAPGALVHYVAQKAVDRCGMIACSGRWRGMLVDLKAHANAIVIFPGGLSVDELEDAAREFGLGHTADNGRKVKPLDELRELLEKTAAHGEHAALLYDRDRDLFRIFEIPAHLLERAIAIEVAPA